MRARAPLSAFRPVEFKIELPREANEALDEVETELIAGAGADANHCMGYFPGLQEVGVADVPPGMDTSAIKYDLPASARLKDIWPHINVHDKRLDCNFFRLSLTEQSGMEGVFHLDRGAASAVTGNADMTQQLVWRGLGNLHGSLARTLEYLDMEPTQQDLKDAASQYLRTGDYDPKKIQSAVLPPRLNNVVHFVMFASNRVWHTGGSQPHFVAAFGAEETL